MKVTLYHSFDDVGPTRKLFGFTVGKRIGQHIPLGIAYLAAVLKKNNFDVEIVDGRMANDEEDIIKKIINTKPDIIGISFMTVHADYTFERIKKLKEVAPDIPIVVGGPHPTIDTVGCLNNKHIDFAFIGESEYSFLKFCQLMENGSKNFETIDGLGYKKDGKIIVNKKNEFIQNLDEIPFPARNLFPMKQIFKFRTPGSRYFLYPYTNLVTSRGCPYFCKFCKPTEDMIYGKRVRFRSPENVVDEMESLVKEFGIKYFAFEDDTFTADRQRLIKFCDLVKERGLNVEWQCQTRVTNIDSELLGKMKEAGCYIIYFGIESGSQHVLDLMDKRVTVDQNIKAIEITRNAGILSFANMMIGYPGETIEDLNQSIQFLIKTNPDFYGTSKTSPMPGTYLYEEVVKAGKLLVKDYSYYHRGYFGPKIALDIPNEVLLGYNKRMERESITPRLLFKKYYFQHMLKRLLCHIKQKNIMMLLIDAYLDLRYIIKPTKLYTYIK